MSATIKNRIAKWMTRIARVIVLGAIIFLLIAWLLQMVWRPKIWESDILYLVYLGIALIGCIASWWRQWLAGILLVLVSFVFGSYLGLSSPWGLAVLVTWSPEFGLPFFVAGMLFLSSWWFSKKTSPSALPPSPTWQP